MNTIFFVHQADPGKNRGTNDETQETVIYYQHEMNTVEGSEFLDDAIRMKDQPLDETNAEDLLEDDFE